jgi:hypothetical protein
LKIFILDSSTFFGIATYIKIMTETNGTKEPRRLIGRRQQRPENPIETANKVEDDEFLSQYVKPRLVYV